MGKSKRKSGFKPEKTQVIFVALELPDLMREKLLEVQNDLKASLPNFKGGRELLVWELPEKLHITVAYVGRISDADTLVVRRALREVLEGMEPFDIQVGYLDYLYQKHGNGLVWMRADGGRDLIDLHKELVGKLNAKGFSLSKKKLVPHITLARLKNMRNDKQKQLLSSLTEKEYPDLGTIEINEVSVLMSRYRRDWKTTEYEVVERVGLGGGNLAKV